LACIERQAAKPLRDIMNNYAACALLVGPEGGFTTDEIAFLSAQSFITPVTLGTNILRSETAVCAGLAVLNQNTE
jgi:16S rRNA (uracil1498-N3)-methyltransferase